MDLADRNLFREENARLEKICADSASNFPQKVMAIADLLILWCLDMHHQDDLLVRLQKLADTARKLATEAENQEATQEQDTAATNRKDIVT